MQKLEIIEADTMKYDGKLIKMHTNMGDINLSYGDAFEVMWTFLDATVGINKETEQLLERIDNEFILNKF